MIKEKHKMSKDKEINEQLEKDLEEVIETEDPRDENKKSTNQEEEKETSLNDELDELSKLKLDLEMAIEDKKRALAEAENTRRRTSKDLEQVRKYGHLSFSRDILAVVDSLERAVISIPSDKKNLNEEIKNVVIGVEMTLEQLKQVFNNHNITQINPEGEKFDYNFHQAMFENESESIEPGTIVEVMQPGWTLHDRLLRPAMVGVSKKPKT